MNNKVTMVDPDEGWRYGFPKRLPDELKGEDITEWLIENGYPSEVIDMWKSSELGYVPCRYWETETINVTEDSK
tara:strand:+ start:108997 stop:109218 length:222 start_codon:yes stop_codon:yes gene_type:complete